VLRFVALLLVLPSLLTPPRVCVCGYASTATPLTSEKERTSPASAAVDTCCSRCCHEDPPPACPDGDPRQAPLPAREHAPCCPALLTAETATLPPPQATDTPGAEPTQTLPFTSGVPSVRASFEVAFASRSSRSSPAYISFCALLI
jgi:hypothetical protein